MRFLIEKLRVRAFLRLFNNKKFRWENIEFEGICINKNYLLLFYPNFFFKKVLNFSINLINKILYKYNFIK